MSESNEEIDVQLKRPNIMHSIIYSIKLFSLLIILMGITISSGAMTVNVENKDIYDRGSIEQVNASNTKLVFDDKIGVPILNYHKIATIDKLEGVPNNMVVTPEELEEQLSYFKMQGYSSISYTELYNFLINKKPIPEKSFIISFDDGFQSNYIYLPELLKKYGFKAEIAIVTGLPRKAHGEVTNGASYFTWEHAIEMEESEYINIESHTANHANLVKSKDIKLELEGSSNDIFKYLGRRTDVIIYPGGSYNDKVIEQAKKYGYTMGVTIEKGLNYFGQDIMKIKRFMISHGETGEQILNNINRYKIKH